MNTPTDAYPKGVKGEIDNRPRRFYADVSVVGEGAPPRGQWSVRLDGKPLRTPEKNLLVLPTEALAHVVADEWRAQGLGKTDGRIDLQSMFNTRLANVAIDRTPLHRGEMGREAARYAATDLVCHLAEAPAALRAQQEAAWAPLRAWAASAHNVKLTAVEGVIACAQPEASVEAVRAHAAMLDDWRLTAFLHATALLGSAVLGLAVERRRLTALEAFDLSRLDEAFQAAQWGEDPEAARTAARLATEAEALDRWFDALV